MVNCMRNIDPERKKLYIGIDLDDNRAMVSFLGPGEKEPVSASVQKPEETGCFPTSLYIGKSDRYLYGAEAEKKCGSLEGEFYDHLFLRARDQVDTETFAQAAEHLAIYLRRLIRMKDRLYPEGDYEQHLLITIPEITLSGVRVLKKIRDLLQNDVDSVFWIDYGESFYYYTFHQEPSVWKHDIAMFDFSEHRIRFTLLARDGREMPQLVQCGCREWETPYWPEDAGKEKDAFFANVLRQSFAKRIVSGVYLLGDGFDGNWLSETLRVLGPNRRVFIGKNLYTKGAAYGAYIRQNPTAWNYRYDCDYKTGTDVGLQLSADGEEIYYPLTVSGEDWFEQEKQLDVILMGSTSIDFSVKRRGDRTPQLCAMQLDDVWKRAEKTRKIRIHTVCYDAHTLHVTVTDLGFGEFFASTGSEWVEEIPLD